MAISHITKDFGIKEAKLLKMTADPAGGAATYGASIPLTGAKKLTLAGTVSTKSLRGDNRLLDADAVLDSVTATFDGAKLNMDALSALFSTPTVDSGTTPNQTALWAMSGTDTMNYVQLIARCASADVLTGDILITLWKCKITAFPSLGFNEEDYQLFNQPLIVMPRLSDGKWVDVTLRETFLAIP